jgi:hypothetical protein
LNAIHKESMYFILLDIVLTQWSWNFSQTYKIIMIVFYTILF